MIRRAYECVIREKACVAGMPVKDTIKVVDEEEFVTDTPDRSSLWMVQTPQVFESELITDAYSMLKSSPSETVTDDAMVVERMMGLPVKMFRGYSGTYRERRSRSSFLMGFQRSWLQRAVCRE